MSIKLSFITLSLIRRYEETLFYRLITFTKNIQIFMEATISQVQEIVSVLTADEQQLLKDTINYGSWGDSEWEFLDYNEEVETVAMYGYCTNDAKRAGHFSGRKVSSMFRSMYKKLCPTRYNQIGRYISHCNDWWGDGRGDMLFIRTGYYRTFEKWAKL